MILATSLAESLHKKFPAAKIDFLLRSGTEMLLENHPFINEVIILDKKKNKTANLLKTVLKIRAKKYDLLVNAHRFGSSGIITFLSGAKVKRGFDKNPFSFSFNKKIKHHIPFPIDENKKNQLHEIERNHLLINDLVNSPPSKPKLYPSEKDFQKAMQLTGDKDYVCIAPASLWFTKQLPNEKWSELIENFSENQNVFLLGAKNDFDLCEDIVLKSKSADRATVFNLAGKLSFLESAALMSKAKMNFVNDSAPLHLASAMNAPVTAFFCSTVPAFGFGPLSERSKSIETKENLSCRPCGIHGKAKCPEGHFKCAYGIEIPEEIFF